MTNPVIPAEAVEAAWDKLHENPIRPIGIDYAELEAALEAAAPYMLVQVHHHDIEHHARSFNEGYETAMAQELADDPTIAQDWLDEKLAAAWDEGKESTIEAYDGRGDGSNPYRSAT